MQRDSVLVQRALPGFGAVAPRRRRRRRSVDPALVESRAAADRAFGDWREAFVGFLARLPEHRRAELRRRLRPPPPPAPARSSGLHRAA